MTQEIVKTFKELVDRLEEAAVPAGVLAGVKLIPGPDEEIVAQKDLPCIMYEILEGGATAEVGIPACVRFDLTAMLTVMTHADNGYYNDQKSGIIDYLEKVMTVIDGYPTLDLGGSGNWGEITPKYRVGRFERDGLTYTYLIEVRLRSNEYKKGAL